MIVVFPREAFYYQQALNTHNMPNVVLVAILKVEIMIQFLEYVKIAF